MEDQTLAKSGLMIGKSQSALKLRELITEPQALKGTIKKHLNLKVKQQDKQFKVIVNNKVIKNYIVFKTVKHLKMPY